MRFHLVAAAQLFFIQKAAKKDNHKKRLLTGLM